MDSIVENIPSYKGTINNDTSNSLRNIRTEWSNDQLLAKQIRSAGIYQPSDMKYNTMFYRTRRIDPHYRIEGATEYLFFTKPDLNLLDSSGSLYSYLFEDNNIYGLTTDQIRAGTQNSSYFVDLYRNGYSQTFLDLSYSATTCNGLASDGCPFVRILSNRKTSNMDIPDISVQELETAQNMYGTRIYYPLSSAKSDEDLEFSIEFEDTQFLEVYHFFKAYDVYRQLKWLGMVSPKKEYIDQKILHDHMSIYKFLVDIDGETILYYAKATGVYPKSISRSAFSEFQEKGQLKITVTFKLSGWFEDMEPLILYDFNQLVSRWKTGSDDSRAIYNSAKEHSLWDPNIQAIDNDNVEFFYIDKKEASEVRTSLDAINPGFAQYYLVAGKL